MNKFIKNIGFLIFMYLSIGLVMYFITISNNINTSFVKNVLLWPIGLLDDLKSIVDLFLLSFSFSFSK